jgi:hypothetical protein
MMPVQIAAWAAPWLMLAHVLLSLALGATLFCRMVRTSKRTTARDVLLAFYALGLAVLVCLVAPVLFDWAPDGVSLSLLAGITAVQFVTARHWRNGVPEQLRKGGGAS